MTFYDSYSLTECKFGTLRQFVSAVAVLILLVGAAGSSYAQDPGLSKLDLATTEALGRSPSSMHVIVRVDPAFGKKVEEPAA